VVFFTPVPLTGETEKWAQAHFFIVRVIWLSQGLVNFMTDPRVRQIAERVAASEGLEVLEVDLRGGKQGLLRIVLDKMSTTEGVTHHDCETVSRQVSAILDVEDLIPFHYTLEVSSPGAERKLSTEKDFQRFTGKLAKVVLREPLAGEEAAELAGQGSLRGRLAGCHQGVVTLEVNGKGGAVRSIQVDLENVSRAQLVLEW
jgi:ribosome maturation factor RimP